MTWCFCTSTDIESSSGDSASMGNTVWMCFMLWSPTTCWKDWLEPLVQRITKSGAESAVVSLFSTGVTKSKSVFVSCFLLRLLSKLSFSSATSLLSSKKIVFISPFSLCLERSFSWNLRALPTNPFSHTHTELVSSSLFVPGFITTTVYPTS